MIAQSPYKFPSIDLKHVNVIVATTDIQMVRFCVKQKTIHIGFVKAVFVIWQLNSPRRLCFFICFDCFPKVAENFSERAYYQMFFSWQ